MGTAAFSCRVFSRGDVGLCGFLSCDACVPVTVAGCGVLPMWGVDMFSRLHTSRLCCRGPAVEELMFAVYVRWSYHPHPVVSSAEKAAIDMTDQALHYINAYLEATNERP